MPEVYAAVSYIPNADFGAAYDHRCDGGAHPGELRRLLSFLKNLPIRQLDCRDDPVRVDREIEVLAKRPSDLHSVARGLQVVLHGGDCQLSRHLPVGVPTHSIRKDEEALRFLKEDPVFILGPNAADIRDAV